MADGAAIDQRLLSVTFGLGGDLFHTYDQKFNIRVRAKKDMAGYGNTCSIDIMNLSEADRNAIVGGFDLWRARKIATPFVPVEIKIGRASTGLIRKVYLGCIASSSMTMPPDINMTIQCITSQNSRIDLSAVDMPRQGTLHALCEWAAKMLNVPLVFEATEQPPLRSPMRLFNIASLPGMLNMMFPGKLSIHIDDDKLIVRDINKALVGPMIDVNLNTGLIGMPNWNEWGVTFTTMADIHIPIGGSVNLSSILNKSVNGQYIVYASDSDLETFGNSWYTTYRASPVAG